jgi:hypothetical protein
MAQTQKSDFIFRWNGWVSLNQRGRQFSWKLAAEVSTSVVVMLDTPCFEVVWRVLTVHSIRQFPLHFPSCASPCAITFQLDSTMIYSEKEISTSTVHYWVSTSWSKTLVIKTLLLCLIKHHTLSHVGEWRYSSLGARWRWVVSVILWLLSSMEGTQVLIWLEAGWTPKPVCMLWKGVESVASAGNQPTIPWVSRL